MMNSPHEQVNERARVEVLLTEKEVARRQSRSVKTLRNQRVTGGGIPFLKLGRSVRYRYCDVIEWELARLVSSTSTAVTSEGTHG